MAWAKWSKDDGKGLSRYVLDRLGDRVRTAHGTADMVAAGDLERVVAEVYDALAERDVRWTVARYQPHLPLQVVRSPGDILDRSGEGTCLDLAVLFAGVLLGRELLPLVVVLDGHALVAVSRVTKRRQAGGTARQYELPDGDGTWAGEGLLVEGKTMRALVDSGRYLLIECTGFARSGEALSTAVPEGRRRVDGLLSFEDAITAGREQLEVEGRGFRFAVDAAYLQDVSGFEVLDPGDELAPSPIQDFRLRFDAVLRDNGVVGGRSTQLAELDAFAARPDQHTLLLTAPAGMGKTALLAEWIRRLRAADQADVLYHFVDRRSTRQEDLLTSLVTQAAFAWGGDPSLVAPGSVTQRLTVRWLEQLRVRRRPVIVVIDGADEAEAAGWSIPRELLETPPGVHVVLSARKMAGHDWASLLHMGHPVQIELGPLDEAGIREVVDIARLPAWAAEPESIETFVRRTGGDPFYLKLLVGAIGQGDITSPAGLAAGPDDLAGYLRQWWDDVRAEIGHREVDTLLGYLVVCRGPITSEELASVGSGEGLRKSVVTTVLNRLSRIIVGDPRTYGVRLTHWRLGEVIADDVLTTADRVRLVDNLIRWCDDWNAHHYSYALRNGVAHRLDRAQARGQPADVLATLGDPDYRKLRSVDEQDAVGLLRDAERCLALLCSSPSGQVVEEQVQAALLVADVRDTELGAGPMLALAERGDLAGAMAQLDPATAAGQWLDVTRLVLAWIAGPTGRAAALDIVHSAAPAPNTAGALLHGRVAASLGLAPEPELTTWFGPLPEWSSPDDAASTLDTFGGVPLSERGISGLVELDQLVGEGDEAGIYLAEQDAPRIVAFARDDPVRGGEMLTRFIDLHASNPYAVYRNRSLLSVLATVCCLPNQDRAREHARHVVAAALEPTGVRFSEHADLVARALRALGGDTSELRRLVTARTEAVVKARDLQWDRGGSDRWGHHARRLAAHGDAAALLDDRVAVRTVLRAALEVPFGYAGFRAPASVALAQAFMVAEPADGAGRTEALDAALRSAHNVQEQAFCIVTTARVATLTRWSAAPPADVREVVHAFVDDPAAARFCPRHRIGERFEHRTRHDHLSIEYVTDMRTPEQLAEELDVPRSAVVRLNTGGPVDSTIGLPDPGFAPLVATWLATQVAVTDLDRAERAGLIAGLLPAAALDATALDLVLARLLTEVRPGLGELAGVQRHLAGWTTVEPAADVRPHGGLP